MAMAMMAMMMIVRISAHFRPFETSMIPIETGLHGEADSRGPGAPSWAQKADIQEK